MEHILNSYVLTSAMVKTRYLLKAGLKSTLYLLLLSDLRCVDHEVSLQADATATPATVPDGQKVEFDALR